MIPPRDPEVQTALQLKAGRLDSRSPSPRAACQQRAMQAAMAAAVRALRSSGVRRPVQRTAGAVKRPPSRA